MYGSLGDVLVAVREVLGGCLLPGLYLWDSLGAFLFGCCFEVLSG